MTAVVLHEDKPNTYDVWAYCGASGVTGQFSVIADLSTNYLGAGTNLQNAQTYSKLSTRRDGEATTSWRDLIPGPTYHAGEITAAYHLNKTYKVAKTAFIVYSQNGTSLVEDWEAGTGYSALAMTRFASELALLGSAYVVRGIFLFLAAADATASAAPGYLAALGTFAARWRGTYPDASLIIQRPSSDLVNEGNNPIYVAQVEAAVNSYVATDSNSIAWNTDDLPFDGTGPHYLTATYQNSIGPRMAYCAARMLYLPRRGGALITTFPGIP